MNREKAATDKVDYDERAFEYLAPNALKEVKKAWIEAAKEIGTNGMGMGKDEKLTHTTAMMPIRLTNQLKGCYSSGEEVIYRAGPFRKHCSVCIISSKTGTL